MSTQKNTKALAIEKPFLSVAEVFGKFPKITCDIMRANDLPSFSAIVGALAKEYCASIDIPLALNPSGKELFNIGKITRVFYAVSQFYDSKVKIDIVENTGLNGDAYFTIHVARVSDTVKLPTREPDKCEIKQESSKKRVEKAQENKQKKENEIQAQVEERAQAVAKEQLEKQSNYMAQKIYGAVEKRLSMFKLNLTDEQKKMLKNDIIAVIDTL
jgi:RNA polymerase-interacting CarD/CdnL/TRCF family regulator